MLEQTIANGQFHLRERQRRCQSALVDPAHAAAADDELVLLEEPVAQGRGVTAMAAADLEARHKDAPQIVTPDLELGAVDEELVEAQLEREQ